MSAADTGERVLKYLAMCREAEVLLDVLLPLFSLPPRSGVAFQRPDTRRRLCGGVPAGVGGFGILGPQLVNVGWGGGRGQLRGHGLVGL